MSYARALHPTKASPCTNVPIHCPICPTSLSGQPRTIWKYNAMYHFATEHQPADKEGVPEIPPSFLVESFLTSFEEKLMGVQQEITLSWREDNNIPDTDGIEEIKASEASKSNRSYRVSIQTQR
ncbi:hypothetical protein L208DRAFT_1295328 [Tricholoma matsutake]|nr:hypothetical protein L208DRAFT_1295328 [Tricholoma matsutake 945]